MDHERSVGGPRRKDPRLSMKPPTIPENKTIALLQMGANSEFTHGSVHHALPHAPHAPETNT